MTLIPVGDKFVAKHTIRNTTNGIDPFDDVRIGFVDDKAISIHVIKKDGRSKQFVVPRDAFGMNFESDRHHLAPPNRGYAMMQHALNSYK
ncbi:MAG: hypothetical protein B7Y31_09930 [Novosphingobium sp. 16-62-11]|uniref:hypothetical protein n=1 Tax=Novosphingobium sp. 17-62-19 TaxID=1970406 RepID=UPI000BDB1360|nr:hypothetical protein [Novosphingobium sp. 17-62-19]OYX95457.1 MAG: hypothetical protein B7Y74_04250 [Novosphingobium sp. 35-62-5]OYZ36802.1 MAG: hypothetical protein B7Y31_09930 [Novosphingobium sp. 16-62-11]OZA20084.1 MAG: hypothetical protein B7X90_06975 [Novosphingobium sp. 17-62-19]HQS97428.1 hypothetical protein [Novosphingobium sp.]